MLRSWFHFISDRQIERGIRNLDDYKVLYIPFAKYERRAVLEKIGEYVRRGGTVVCTDPDAFTWDITGKRLTPDWEQLIGVNIGDEIKGQLKVKTRRTKALPSLRALEFELPGPGRRLLVKSRRVRRIASFADGSPAITVHQAGEGRVIFFAADPFGMRGENTLVRPSSPLMAIFEAVQESVGATLGRDIWRFKLPPAPPHEKEKGLCLTNNYVFDRNLPLRESGCVDTGGSYGYSRYPTGSPDRVKAGKRIPFSRGRLTDRARAYETRSQGEGMNLKKASSVALEWVVSWRDRKPVAVTFDIRKAYALTRVRLVYSGVMPALQISGSRDGRSWRTLASSPEQEAGEDVKDVVLSFTGRYRHVRLAFAARQRGESFTLCEVEIWGG